MSQYAQIQTVAQRERSRVASTALCGYTMSETNIAQYLLEGFTPKTPNEKQDRKEMRK